MTYKIINTGNITEDVKEALHINSLNDSVDFYDVSLPTIQRWRAESTKIPTWTNRTYSYYLSMLSIYDKLKEDREKLEEERKEFLELKRDLSDYFELENKIKSYLTS